MTVSNSSFCRSIFLMLSTERLYSCFNSWRRLSRFACILIISLFFSLNRVWRFAFSAVILFEKLTSQLKGKLTFWDSEKLPQVLVLTHVEDQFGQRLILVEFWIASNQTWFKKWWKNLMKWKVDRSWLIAEVKIKNRSPTFTKAFHRPSDWNRGTLESKTNKTNNAN